MERFDVDLQDMLAFLRVAETGSFVRAADRLGTSKSIVSRRVARLETQLGTALLTRNARGAIPTEIGRGYQLRIAALFSEFEAANEAASAAASSVAGEIRLTASIGIGVDRLVPILAQFARENPRIELDVVLDDRPIDLLAEHFDLALRIGRLADSSLIVRRLAPVEAVIVASPAYLDLHGRPSHPRELSGHQVLFYGNVEPGAEWRFNIDGRWQRLRLNSRIRINNGDAMREMARAGLGIAALPDFLAADAVSDGSLELVLEAWPLEAPSLYAVMPPGRAALARVRALVDHLAKGFGNSMVAGRLSR